MKLLGKSSKKMIDKVVNKEKEMAVEFLESFLGKENALDFDLNGVIVRLGSVKLKLKGNVEVTVILPKKG